MTSSLPGYRIVKHLHKGRRSTVSRAIRLQDDCEVVIKQLNAAQATSEEIGLFQHEYELLSLLDINGVIRPLNQLPTEQGIATIFADEGGISLRQLISRDRLPWYHWLPFAVSLTELLGEIHKAKIIHKQLSPDNIIVDPAHPEQGLQIIDFTQATHLQREQASWNYNQLAVEALPYIAPEQTGRINRAIDYRTDFYALGATLYELMTGQPPFSDEDRMALVHCHIAKQPEPMHTVNRDIPEVVSQIICKLLAKDASERYQSIFGLIQDLKTCQEEWARNKRIEPFSIASEDRSERFVIPQRLYGRADIIKRLLNCYDRTTRGHQSLVMISGYAGIGKSSLVHEIRQYVNARGGSFISGKFDQFRRNRPYAAITFALQSLIRQLLTESESSIDLWRRKLLEALGDNAEVFIRLIPELELIVGKQPDAPKLALAEEQNRFSRLFMRLIQTLASAERPLVMFLDDLHWADLASIKLIRTISEQRISHLMLVGSFRHQEVEATHPLADALQRIRQSSAELAEYQLDALTLSQVNQLIADTLQYSPDRCASLARISMEKTQGNPFFLNQFLTTLYEDGLIHFSRGHWIWNEEQIRQQAMTDNVVELMVSKIQKLSPNTQRMLKLASCIGSPFSLRILSVVHERTPQETAADLWQAMAERLIIPLDNNYHLPGQNSAQETRYRFIHDRVQQAAYSLISEDARLPFHLRIGQLARENYTAEEFQGRIFEITNHLNIAKELITDTSEQLHLAELNLKAGVGARDAAAFDTAYDYFNTGLALLPHDRWQTHYALTLQLYTHAAEIAYIRSDFEHLQSLIDHVLNNAQHLLEKVRLYEILIQAHISRNAFDAALDTALQVLSLLGIEIPRHPGRGYHWKVLLKTQLLMRRTPPEDVLNLPTMNDENVLAALPILASMFGAVKFSSSDLRPIIMAKQVELTLKQGLGPSSALAFAGYGGVLCGRYDAIEQGYRMGKAALAIDDKLPSRLTHHKTLSLFNSYIRHWKEPLSNTLDSLQEGYHRALDCGDVEWGTYCIAAYIQYGFTLAKDLEGMQPQMEQYLSWLQASGQKQSEQYSRLALQTIDNLRGVNEFPTRLDGRFYDEETFLQDYKENNHRTAICLQHMYKALLYYLFGDYQKAAIHSRDGEQLISSIHGTYAQPWLHYISAMCQLAVLPETGLLQQPARIRYVKRILKRTRDWADHCPTNHLHHYKLIKAELARVQKRYTTAMDLFDEAIEACRNAEITLDLAQAYELAAKLYLDWGKPHIARTYLEEGLSVYKMMGAQAKVEQMLNLYRDLLNVQDAPINGRTIVGDNHTPSVLNNQAIDIASVIKASHVIADEIVLEQLLGRLMTLAQENAGAQRAILALKRGQALFIEAEAGLQQEPTFFSSMPVEDGIEKLPVNVVHYVARTKETVVLSNALEHEMFMHDSYIRLHNPRSMLCMPILYHGELTAVLYLENNESAGVFTRERLETLQILSAQAAISIENAKLYSSLQQSESEFRSLFENAVEGIFRASPDGSFLSANPALASILGHDSPDDFLQAITDVASQCFEQQSELERFMDQLNSANQLHNFETRWLNAHRHPLDVSISARRVLDSQGHVLYYEGSLTDISERKQREQAESERIDAEFAREKAEAASEAKSQFLATMSHEIRTPMNGILGMAQLLQRGALSDEQRLQVETIYNSGQSLLAILNDVLDFTKVEAGQMELDTQVFSLRSLQEEIHQSLKPTATEKGLDLIMRYDHQLPEYLSGDRRIISQILLNLCSNALKFTNEGMVSLRIRLRKQLHHSITVRFEVEDTGIGIPAESHSRIFEHFSQADSSITRRFGGTGLGLSICRRLVELQQGELGCISEPGKGSLFWFEIPLGQTDQRPTREHDLVPVTQDAPLDILLVEDTEINQQVTAGLLEREGHHVTIADDGYTALSLHSDNDYDLILMDIHLPDMDGMETTRRMRQHPVTEKANVRIAAYTASVTDTEVQQYLAAGADSVLAKPLQFSELQVLLGMKKEVPQPAVPDCRLDHALLKQHLEMLGVERLKQLIEQYTDQADALFAQLNHLATDQANHHEFSQTAHKLAGASANFGMVELSQQMKTLEKSDETDSTVLKPAIDKAMRIYQGSLAEIQRLIDNG